MSTIHGVLVDGIELCPPFICVNKRYMI